METKENEINFEKAVYTSYPFLVVHKNQVKTVNFYYYIGDKGDKKYFKVANIILQYNEIKELELCDLEIEVDMEKWNELYKENQDFIKLLQEDENVRNEFTNFIQSDMSDESLKNKYKPLLSFYEKVELDHSKYLSEIMGKELSPDECLALVKKYNNHARVAPLYEEVINFLNSLD